MITGAVSVVPHNQYSIRRLSMIMMEPGELEPAIRILLGTHSNCVAGEGDTPQCCGARQQLLKTRVERGWTWPVPEPSLPVARRGLR